MDRKRELAAAEDAAWVELWGLMESAGPDRVDEPGYSEDWSLKDLMAHIGCWQAEAVQVLEQVRNGTYSPRQIDVDTMNQGFYEANRDLPVSVVRAEMWSARNRMLQEWGALPEVTPKAEEWFVESGAEHYGEHLPRLREWLAGTG
jgi:Mycothiol maleylpyruvate isomerase N-terminal domain